MKKLLIVFVTVLSLFLTTNVEAKVSLPEKTDHEKVNVYLFWSSTCHNCHNLIKYFSDKYQEYTDYFEFVGYQTDSDQNNSSLASTIAETVGEKPGYVPLVVIGKSYHVLGWDDSLGNTIINEALKAYQDDEYTDIVANYINEEKLDVNSTTFTQICSIAGIKCGEDAKSKIDSKVAICFVSAVIVLGIGGLVYLTKKN